MSMDGEKIYPQKGRGLPARSAGRAAAAGLLARLGAHTRCLLGNDVAVLLAGFTLTDPGPELEPAGAGRRPAAGVMGRSA
jgi:hypothetical protein